MTCIHVFDITLRRTGLRSRLKYVVGRCSYRTAGHSTVTTLLPLYFNIICWRFSVKRKEWKDVLGSSWGMHTSLILAFTVSSSFFIELVLSCPGISSNSDSMTIQMNCVFLVEKELYTRKVPDGNNDSIVAKAVSLVSGLIWHIVTVK